MKGILIDAETGDLLILNGSLRIGDTTGQVAEAVLQAARGELKEYPLIGAEIFRLVNGNTDPFWCQNAKEMLLACDVSVSQVRIKDNQITIE